MTNLKILVVEDDPVTQLLLEKKLKGEGYDVETAKDGVAAMNFISESYYDVVLTDLLMPGELDGIGVLENVKVRNEKTEVILITAYVSVEMAVKAMKKGASDYLTKPINFDELMIRLEKIGTIKSLARDAMDLREAMDMTEKSASQTIQELEMMVSELQSRFSDLKKLLKEDTSHDYERIKKALDLIETLVE